MVDLLYAELGKYTVIRPCDGPVHALRHGQPWRDYTGDELVLALSLKVVELSNALSDLKSRLA